MQDLKYIDVRSKGPIHSTPTRWQKALYGLFTVGGRYAWDKWENWLIGQSDGYDEVRIAISILALNALVLISNSLRIKYNC